MIPLRSLGRAALAAMLVASSGCSLALQTAEAQCSTDAECEARGGEFAGTVCLDQVCQTKPEPADPKWGCVGHVDPPMTGGMDTIKLQFLDVLSTKPAKDISVKLCNKYDPMCAAPLDMPVPDDMGWVSSTVPSDVETYYEVTSNKGAYMPALVFMDHVASDKNTDIDLVPPDVVKALATTAGVELDPAAGVVLARTTDCTHARTAGASVTIFPSNTETRFYLINFAAQASATMTDNAGNAGFVNVKPGNPSITGTIGPEGKEFGKATTLVRAGYMTFQLLRPSATL